MGPSTTSPVNDFLGQPWARPALLGASALMVAAAAWFLYIAQWGYGSVRFSMLPANAVVYINSHKIAANTLTLRPGTYRLAITAPTIDPYEGTFHVDLFHQTTVATLPLIPRNINAVASSLLGAIPGTSIPPTLTSPQWFENNNWVVGSLQPAPEVIVLHYNVTQKQWSVAFLSNTSSYPADLSSLPADVAAYVQPLLTEAT